MGGSVAVEDVGELSDRGRDFEAEVEDFLLALKAYVFGPLHHAREVAAGLDVLAYAEVARALFDERVLLFVAVLSIPTMAVRGRRKDRQEGM